jgi:phosphate uptake regulator
MPLLYTVSDFFYNDDVQTADQSLERVDELVKFFIQHYQSILQQAQEDPTSDYSRTAFRELSIKEDAMAIVQYPCSSLQLARLKTPAPPPGNRNLLYSCASIELVY